MNLAYWVAIPMTSLLSSLFSSRVCSLELNRQGGSCSGTDLELFLRWAIACPAT
jgi:hypothetical protein